MSRSMASRPSAEQVVAIVNFMEIHPKLALGQLRGLEGSESSKKLWLKLTRIVNDIRGPTRPMKSWVKFWADKKSMVRSKVVSSGGDTNLSSHIEKKIWDLFLANSKGRTRNIKKESKKEKVCVDNESDSYYDDNDRSDYENHIAPKNVAVFDDDSPLLDRHMAAMDRLVAVMAEQANALSQMASASSINGQSIEKIAESTHIQARAINRLASTFETIVTSAHDIRSAVCDIDNTMKRYYGAAAT